MWTKHGPGTSRSWGQRRSASRTLAGKETPAGCPRQASPAWAIALLGGALAGSGPGTSPNIDGLSLVTGMNTLAPYLSKPCARWRVSWTTWHRRADHSWCSEADARRLRRWDSNPLARCPIAPGRRDKRSSTCDSLYLSRPLVPSGDRRVPMPCGPSTDQPRDGTVSLGSMLGRAPGGHGIRWRTVQSWRRFAAPSPRS